MIYLISNNPDITLDSYLFKETDQLYLFNHAKHLHNPKIYLHPNKSIFLRGNLNNSYWGYKEYIKYYKLYKKVILIPGYKIQPYTKIKSLSREIDIISPNNNYNVYDYTINKYPTSGFIAYFYVKNFASDICLIGFTGSGSGGKGWHKHDYDYEQKYYKSNRVCMI